MKHYRVVVVETPADHNEPARIVHDCVTAGPPELARHVAAAEAEAHLARKAAPGARWDIILHVHRGAAK